MTTESIRTAFNGDCNDPNFQIFIAGAHRISKWNFDSWTRNYNPHNLLGKTFSKEHILSLIQNVDGCSMHIEVGPPEDQNDCYHNEGLPDTNEDIELNIASPIIVTYSIALFRGIINFFQPDQFTFYKARKFETNFDIIFKAEKFIGGAVEDPTIVYYGDVSETQP